MGIFGPSERVIDQNTVALLELTTGLRLQNSALKSLTIRIETLSHRIEDLLADVEAQTAVIASATTLLTKLHDDLVAAGTDPEKLHALAEKIESNTAALAAAVAANTPAAPSE